MHTAPYVQHKQSALISAPLAHMSSHHSVNRMQCTNLGITEKTNTVAVDVKN